MKTILQISESELTFPNSRVFLGRGAHGSVELANYKGISVAVKTLFSPSASASREIEKMHLLQGPKILTFYGVFGEDQKLVTEKMDTSLWKFLHNNPERAKKMLDENPSLAFRLCDDITQGLMQIHSHKHIHNDLSSENILLHRLTEYPFYEAKIADFGRSRDLHEESYLLCGNVFWAAPEVAVAKKQDRLFLLENDIFSLGTIMWEIVSFLPPFYEFDPNEPKKFRDALLDGYRPHIPSSCHPIFADLIRRCWEDFGNRISLEEIHQTLLKLIEKTEFLTPSFQEGETINPEDFENLKGYHDSSVSEEDPNEEDPPFTVIEQNDEEEEDSSENFYSVGSLDSDLITKL